MASPSKLVGSETPRIWTKPLRELTPETSYGFSVIEFAEDICGVSLFPWQKWLLIHALEKNEDGGLRFRNVVVLVARQNGKSMLSAILSLWMLYVMGVKLVIGTAQDLDVAEEIWQESVDIVEETDELNELKEKVVRVNGKKSLNLKTGERYKVKAANRRAGRGLSGDFILLDELREHQNFEAWGAITKTTMARPDAQVWSLSNAGDATSVVLRHLRKMAHEALGDPDGLNIEGILADEQEGAELMSEADLGEDTLGIFEWSAAPDCAIGDREAWAQSNPSLGHGTLTERAIASAARTDPEWVFRTEVLCQWSDGSLEGPFPPGCWESGVTDDPGLAGDVEITDFAIDTSVERETTYVLWGAQREDGKHWLEVTEARHGQHWVADWFRERVDKYPGMRVSLQARGAPVSPLLEELQTVEGLEVVPWQGSDIPNGSAGFYDAVCSEDGSTVMHLPTPALDLAAATAVTRPLGEAWAWDRRKSPVDISPLVAATNLHWLLNREPEQPFVSAYAAENWEG